LTRGGAFIGVGYPELHPQVLLKIITLIHYID